MTETHTQERRIVDERGTLLFFESKEVLVDGDDVRVNSERRVRRCPNCDSRLDQVDVIGRCWECAKQICINCGTKAACCGRTLCEDHRHMSVLINERIWVCSEHAPTISARQAFYDANVLFDQRMKERTHRHEAELRERDMKLKEYVASFQNVLGCRHQSYQEALARQRLYLEHARLRMQQLQAIAPSAYSLLANHRRRPALTGRRG